MKKCPMLPGRSYEFSYPRHNYVGLPERSELRRVTVTAVRDIKSQPLDAETTELNPTLNRGRWLVTGEDLDKGAERSFYVESMDGLREMTKRDLSYFSAKKFCVVDHRRVCFMTDELEDALAFRAEQEAGAVYGRFTVDFSSLVAPVLPRRKTDR